MAFSSFKSIGEVLKPFQVTYTESNFIGEIKFNIPDYFRDSAIHRTTKTHRMLEHWRRGNRIQNEVRREMVRRLRQAYIYTLG